MLKNIVYFGSAQFTADIFDALLEAKIVNIVAVVTTPDRPVGRKQIVTPSPLALAAEKYDLPVYKPEKLDEANLAHLRLLKPDIFLVVAYGQYFTESWLKTPSLATLNIHFSLLPKYRGSLCISEALKNGDEETGVTLMEMAAKLDAGNIIAQQKVKIDLGDNCDTLNKKLTTSAKQLLLHDFVVYLDGGLEAVPQNEALATITPSFKTKTRQNAFVSYEDLLDAMQGKNAITVHNFIRSQNPDPGAWTIVSKSKSVIPAKAGIHPTNSTELKLLKTTIKKDKLVIESVQVPGKNPIPWSQFS
jgi:methionyl-tRNA formyltransferase